MEKAGFVFFTGKILPRLTKFIWFDWYISWFKYEWLNTWFLVNWRSTAIDGKI
jgi:hypothetical protein